MSTQVHTPTICVMGSEHSTKETEPFRPANGKMMYSLEKNSPNEKASNKRFQRTAHKVRRPLNRDVRRQKGRRNIVYA